MRDRRLNGMRRAWAEDRAGRTAKVQQTKVARAKDPTVVRRFKPESPTSWIRRLRVPATPAKRQIKPALPTAASGAVLRQHRYRNCAACLEKFCPAFHQGAMDAAYCGRRCANRTMRGRQTEAARRVHLERIGQALRARVPSPEEIARRRKQAVVLQRPDVVAKAHANSIRWMEEHPEEAARIRRMGRRLNGKEHPMYGKVPRINAARYRTWCAQDGRWYRSSWERDLAAALRAAGVVYKYESRKLDTPFGTYTPDFDLGGIYVEVKGVRNRRQEEKIAWLLANKCPLVVIRGAGEKQNRRPDFPACVAELQLAIRREGVKT